MQQLTRLNLSGCTLLARPPASISKMSCLQELQIDGCPWEKLSESLDSLSRLQVLSLNCSYPRDDLCKATLVLSCLPVIQLKCCSPGSKQLREGCTGNDSSHIIQDHCQACQCPDRSSLRMSELLH